MDLTKLIGVNNKIDNIHKFPIPYGSLFDGQKMKADDNKRMVIFFGNDMSGILDLGICDKESYIERANKCLDYVRNKFPGYDFNYKPHPADKMEQSYLNLKDFNIVRDNLTAELFLWNNINNIRAVFGITSLSTFNAYSMGLDSHAFYRFFSDIYGQNHKWIFDDMYFEMPGSFFITDLDQELINNSRPLVDDNPLKSSLGKVLNKNSGKVWFICSFSESIVLLIALSKIIKSIDPNRKVGLIINRHHRWDSVNVKYFDKYFDDIGFVPRVHYSVKLAKLFEVIKVAWKIKNFGIHKNDILIAVSQPEFVENCFISYHRNSHSIAILTNRDFNAQYNPHNLIYSNHDDFRFNKATWFFNKILEPILGLNRTLYLAFTSWKGFYQSRYQDPINEVFDEVYLLSTEFI